MTITELLLAGSGARDRVQDALASPLGQAAMDAAGLKIAHETPAGQPVPGVGARTIGGRKPKPSKLPWLLGGAAALLAAVALARR